MDLIDPEAVEIEDLVRRYEGSVVNALRRLVPMSIGHRTRDSYRRPWNGAPIEGRIRLNGRFIPGAKLS